MKPLKIFQILPALSVGGVERVVLALCRAALSDGHFVTLMAGNGPLSSELEQLPNLQNFRWIDASSAMKTPAAMLTFRSKLARAIAEEKPHVVHVHSRLPGWIYLTQPERAALSVYSIHAAHQQKSQLKRSYNAVHTRFDAAIAVSAHVAEYSARTQNARPASIQCFPLGPEPEFFAPKNEDSDRRAHALRTTLGISAEASVLVSPSRLSDFYDIAALLTGLAALPPGKRPYLLFGPGSDARCAAVLNQANALGLGQQVLQLPAGVNRLAMYDFADAVISLSKREPAFGLVLAEGLARGKPIIATNSGGAAELLSCDLAQKLGSQALANNTSLRVAAVISKVQEAENTIRITAEDKRAFAAKFSLSAHCQNLLALYQQQLGIT